MSRAEALESSVRAGDLQRIREVLLPLTESERAELQPTVRTIVAAEVKEGTAAVRRLGPMLMAAYGTLPASELRKLGWRSLHIPEGLESVLRGRSPERLRPIVELLLDVGGGSAWYPVRALVRERLIAPPDGPGYTIALLAATQYKRAADLVAEDPGVLELEAWRLFEVEGGGEFSLAGFEKYTGDSWGDFFRHLAAHDQAARARLLDASLAALARDFGAFRAGWFSRFHESLGPTDDERATRAASYLTLLRSRTRPTVSFAIAALIRISKAGRLEPKAILGAVEPVLQEAPVGTARAALRLVGQAGAEAGRAHEAARVATAALAHQSAEVQGQALKLIDKLAPDGDAVVAQALAEHLEEVAPSQRATADAVLARLRGGGGSSGRDVDPGVVPREATRPAAAPPAIFDGPRARDAVLRADRRVMPIETVDELIDTAVSVVETGEPPEDVERILEAVGRLPADRSASFVRSTAALAKRCRSLLERDDGRPLSGYDARGDIAAVLLGWANGTAVEPASARTTEAGAGLFLSARAAEIASAAGRGQLVRTVALPTHVGGWIEPAVLVERLLRGVPASRSDLVAAILRLAPVGRTDALQAAGGLAGEVGAVLRYALGGEEAIGPTAAWWVAAARARAPGADDARVERRHPGLGPDAGRAARVEIAERPSRGSLARLVLEAEPEPSVSPVVELPTVLFYLDAAAHDWFGGSHQAAMLRWMATVQPGYREAWAALGAVVMARNVDWWSAAWANRVYLEPFLEPLARIGPQAERLLGIALGAKEAGERGLASDIVALALADGRLTAASLSDGLVAASVLGCDRPQRWARSLGDVAATSRAHAGAVAASIAVTLPAVAGRQATALVPLLRLLDELLAATAGSPQPADHEALRSLADRGGQTGRLARSILART